MYVLQFVLRIHNPPNHVVYLSFYCILVFTFYITKIGQISSSIYVPCTSEGRYLGSKSHDFGELYLPILYKMVIYFANIHLDRYIGSCSEWFVYCLVGFVNKIYQYHASLSV